MEPTHEQVLAGIADAVQAEADDLDQVDQLIADELGVPASYYFAYLLVWAAIEAYRHRHHPASGTGRVGNAWPEGVQSPIHPGCTGSGPKTPI